MNRYSLTIDQEACWGCRACEVACKQELNTPAGIQLIKILEDGPGQSGDKPEFIFHIQVCRHCDDPPCAEVCPAEAIAKRGDGIVVLDREQCTGCGLCAEQCPYDAISTDRQGLAYKCNLCLHRVDNGLVPACADNVCLAYCINFMVSETQQED